MYAQAKEPVRRLIRADFERQTRAADIATVPLIKEISVVSELREQLADLTNVVRDLASRP